MKKYLSILLAVVVLLYAFAFSASAQSAVTEAAVTQQDGSVIYYHDNGTYTVVSVVEAEAGARSEAKTKTATVTASNYEDSDNSLNWTYVLTATFSYTEGESATCTAASYSQTISNSSWQFSDGSATKSGNTAHGTGTFVRKWLFITRETVPVNLYISCDSYGNITKGSNG